MALRIGTWDVDFRPQGWIRLKEQDGGPIVYLHFQQSGPPGQERFDMQSVVMKSGSDEALSGRTWRRIPMSNVEALFQEDEVRAALTAPCDVQQPSLDNLEEYFEATKGNVFFSAAVTSGMWVGDGSQESPAGKFPMVRAPQGRLTDEFLQDVADAYRWLTDASKPPAPSIADMAKVPVRTVHRWIYEARKRGFLPPARAGRAG